jgi:hypothetical protein
MARLADDIPVEPRCFKRAGSVRVGDLLAFSRVVEPGETSKLASPASSDRFSKVLLEIAEK